MDQEATKKRKRQRCSYTYKEKVELIMEYKNANACEMDKNKKVNLKPWLQDKNNRDGTSLAYMTVFKWYKQFKDMDPLATAEIVTNNHTNSLKRIRSRPYQELEKILVDILRIRNKTLFAKGLPLSDAAFIKSRAEELYADLYVPDDDDNSNKDFKCSVGWISRFKERHKHDIDPLMKN
eukprot:95951_1